MKNNIYFLSIIVLLSLASCKSTALIPYERTGEVIPLSHERSIIKVQSSSKGSDASSAISHAERQAFENIIYKGIPNSNQETALIGSETNAWRDHKSVLESVIVKRGYLQYIISSETADLQKSGGVSYVKQNVEIDLGAFRKMLVEENVIKKFGL